MMASFERRRSTLETTVPAWLELHSVDFGYRQGHPILTGLDLALRSASCTALIGANGSGKTTLGKLIAGLLRPWKGRILIQGEDLSQFRLGEIGKRIGYVFQEPDRQLFASTVWDEMVFPARFSGMLDSKIEHRAKDLLERLGLNHLREDFPQNLSRGEKQRLAIAAVLMQNPPFLVLDEPTTGLDRERRQELGVVVQTLKDQGAGLLLISHDDRFVQQNADRVLTLAKGVIVSDASH